MTAAIPMMIAYAPASVSTSCDKMLDQLNDISFLGNPQHKDRCTHLASSQAINQLMLVLNIV